jgi:hypothetical protein
MGNNLPDLAYKDENNFLSLLYHKLSPLSTF